MIKLNNTLYVSDLDGTLLDRESKIQEVSKDIINNLISKGMKFTIATARSWSSAAIVLKGLNLTLPVATYNGAFIVDPISGNIIESNCFERAQADYVLNTFIQAGIYPLVYAFINGEEKVSWLEVKRFDATKAIGIEKLKKMTGCSRVISFGDSANDLPMFSISDEAYTVSNANPKLIEAATEVIGCAEDNGVARWLKENVNM